MHRLILHIPHASRIIPAENRASMMPDEATLTHELLRMTDAWTDALVDGLTLPAARIVFPVSRLVVDPERFPDDIDEPMAAKGMGAVYTRLSTGGSLRNVGAAQRAELMDRWYWPHHRHFEAAVDAALAEHGRCLIVDVHSFSSIPLPHEADQDPDRPEVCIGIDAFHSPFRSDQEAVEITRGVGFATACLNRPFAGSLVPSKHWQRMREVKSVMIEVRRDLYMDQETGEQRSGFGTMVTRVSRLIETVHAVWSRPSGCHDP